MSIFKPMQVSAVSKNLAASLATRRGAAVAAVVGLAAALSIASLSRPDLASAVGDRVSKGVSNIETVAAMIADRSPGERTKGALATLKSKRQSALHERALAKVRGPVPPASPLMGLLTTPPIPPIATPAAPAPLFNLVAGAPVVVPPAAIVAGGPPVVTPPNGVIPGGPGGGGGGVVVPPAVVTPMAPVTPETPAVPEPTCWAMMLVGFALMGRAIRRNRRTATEAAAR